MIKSDAVTQTRPIRRGKLPRILALVVFWILLSWLALEVFVRVGFDLLPPSVQADVQHVQQVPWSDERIIPRIPWVADTDFQLRLPPGIKDFPVHWSDAKFTFNTISAWDGHRVGFRSDPPRWPLDILTFGDSFTFCWTTIQDCWVHRLQTDYDYHVFDAASPGTGTTGQFNLMKELVPPYKPKLVIWTWYNNDITDDYDLARIRGEVDELQRAPESDPPQELQGLSRYSAVYMLLEKGLNPPAKKSPYQHYWFLNVHGRRMIIHTNEYPYGSDLSWSANNYGWQQNIKSHEAGAKLIADNNAKMLLVIIPTREEAYSAYLQDSLGQTYLDQMGKTRQLLLDQCIQNGWDCIDALPVFQEAIKNGQTIYYAFDSHLDASGNKVLEDLIHSYIVSHNLLSN
jgi:hypothetical protein